MVKVSVIIPVYNQEKYIRECVESALNQDYKNIEIIVVDDGSTDNTAEIVKEFGKKIRYQRQENRGVAGAFNAGLRMAEGSLVAWLSSDDFYLPGKIRIQVEKFIGDPDLALVYTDWILTDTEGHNLRVFRAPFPAAECFVREMLIWDFVTGSSMMFKKECFEIVGYFDEELPTANDADMAFRLLKHGYHFGHVPIPLVKYTYRLDNLTHNYRLMQIGKDRVRTKAVEMFSTEELFGDLLKEKEFNETAAYEKLAWVLAKGFHFHAAEAAVRKAIHVGGPFRKGVLLLCVLKMMDTNVILDLFARIRKKRRLWLDRRLIRKSLDQRQAINEGGRGVT